MTVKQFKLSKVRLWRGTGCECQTCNSWHVTTCRSWSVPNYSTTRFQQSCFKYFQSVKGFKTDDSDNIWHHVEANSTLQTSPDSRPWRSPEIHSALLEGPRKKKNIKGFSCTDTLTGCVHDRCDETDCNDHLGCTTLHCLNLGLEPLSAVKFEGETQKTCWILRRILQSYRISSWFFQLNCPHISQNIIKPHHVPILKAICWAPKSIKSNATAIANDFQADVMRLWHFVTFNRFVDARSPNSRPSEIWNAESECLEWRLFWNCLRICRPSQRENKVCHCLEYLASWLWWRHHPCRSVRAQVVHGLSSFIFWKMNMGDRGSCFSALLVYVWGCACEVAH